MQQSISFYTQRILTYKDEINQLKKINRNLSVFRFFSAVGAFVLFYVLLPYSTVLAAGISAVLFCALLYFVKKYKRNEKRIKKRTALIRINENELDCLRTRHSKLFYDGEVYLDPNHPYASDLDVFGPHSLFQLINRSVTKIGNKRLASWLSFPSSNQEIKKRQEAVEELSEQIDWRQDIMQYGLSNQLKNDDPDFIISWGKTGPSFYGNKLLRASIFILPVLSLFALYYSFVGSQAPLLLLIFINVGIQAFNYRKVNKAHNQTEKRSQMLMTYSYIIQRFEQQNWKSSKLNELQQQLSGNGQAAAFKIQKLSKLIELLDQRFNLVVQLLFNLLFFYELHILFRIDKWKLNYGAETEKWFAVIGDVEAISSMANLRFNHNNWCFPEICKDHFQLDIEDAGHPMIDEKKRVGNDYQLTGPGMVHLVTGSNMAGKSTFLRTIGVNVVLALSGAPVCAKKMRVSNVEVNTSMRIKDSIEENESSFYAELKRIQQVIEKVNRKEKTLLLLDEILRGTNSKDKHTGSKALIRQLVKYDAVALVATHDLELSVLEQELPGKVENRFFDITIDGEQLYFDYKVQNGVCKTFNAPILMRKMGIEMS